MCGANIKCKEQILRIYGYRNVFHDGRDAVMGAGGAEMASAATGAECGEGDKGRSSCYSDRVRSASSGMTSGLLRK